MDNDSKDRVLTPTVVKLGIVSFLADVASEMLYPVTPIFLTSILGASMASVGLIEGVAEAIASLLKTYSGAWSDAVAKRKPFILLGYLLAAISKPAIGMSHSWFDVLGARALDRTGKGIRGAPRDALLAESVDKKNRGAAFGWHRAMDTLGAAVGPLLAVYLLTLYGENVRPLFYWAIIPGVLSVIAVLSIRERAVPRVKLASASLNPFSSWSKFDSRFRRYILAWGVFSLANSSDVFLLMKAKTAGLSTQTVILLYCFYNLTYALSSPYLGKLSDNLPRKNILIGGLCIFALVYLGMGFATTPLHFFILFLIYGFYMGATDGVGKAVAVDLAPPDLKATGVGLLGTATGLCTIFASTVAGQLWDHVGPTSCFLYGAAGALISILIMRNS